MGRRKITIETIKNKVKRRRTFKMRYDGLKKKAYELSVLCDVDLALLTFSPKGKFEYFSRPSSRIEDFLIRFLNGPIDQEVNSSNGTANKEKIAALLEQLKVRDDGIAGASSQQQKTLDQTGTKAVEDIIDPELVRCHQPLETMKGYLRLLYGDVPPITSPSDFDTDSWQIVKVTSEVKKLKRDILNSLTAASPGSMPITQTIMPLLENLKLQENWLATASELIIKEMKVQEDLIARASSQQRILDQTGRKAVEIQSQEQQPQEVSLDFALGLTTGNPMQSKADSMMDF